VLCLPSCSLAHLLEHYCGFKADKRYQLADWRVRPLGPDMLHYARWGHRAALVLPACPCCVPACLPACPCCVPTACPCCVPACLPACPCCVPTACPCCVPTACPCCVPACLPAFVVCLSALLHHHPGSASCVPQPDHAPLAASATDRTRTSCPPPGATRTTCCTSTTASSSSWRQPLRRCRRAWPCRCPPGPPRARWAWFWSAPASCA
jgi:hypothetical protein